MAYIRVNWEDSPSTITPINATNLNKMDKGIKDLEDSLSTVAISGNYNDLSNKPNDHLVNVSNEVDEDYRVNFLKSKNLFNNAITNNTWINQSGEVISYPLCSVFRYDCSEGDTFTLSAHWSVSDGVNNGGIIAFYSSNGTLLSRNPSSVSNDLVLTKTAPANTAYMYAGHFSAVPQTIQLEKGSSATTYEPYVVPSIYVDGEKIYNKPSVDVDTRMSYTPKFYSFNSPTTKHFKIGTYKMIFMYGTWNSVRFAGLFRFDPSSVAVIYLTGSPTISFSNVSNGEADLTIPSSTDINILCSPDMEIK